MATTRECPKCGNEYGVDVVICVPCGVDLRTGHELTTETDPEKKPAGGMRALLFVGNLAPGLFRPAVLITAILLAVGGWVAFSFGMAMVAMVPLGAISLGAGGLIIYAQAIAMVLGGGFMLLHDAMVDFDGRQWTLFFVILGTPLAAIFILINLAAQSAG